MIVFPEFTYIGLHVVDRHCIDLVAALSLAGIAEHMTSPWRRADPTRQG